MTKCCENCRVSASEDYFTSNKEMKPGELNCVCKRLCWVFMFQTSCIIPSSLGALPFRHVAVFRFSELQKRAFSRRSWIAPGAALRMARATRGVLSAFSVLRLWLLFTELNQPLCFFMPLEDVFDIKACNKWRSVY